jgi:hypothetical protein
MNTTIEFTVTGISPLLMHSDRFADPVSPETVEHKKLTSKRTKTTQDHHAISRSEWMGGLYYDEQLGIYIPSHMIRASLIEGAKLFKLGRHIQRSVVFLEHRGFSLIHNGPGDPEKLYENRRYVDRRSVKVGTAKLFRCRPRFEQWSAEGVLILNEAMLSLEDMRKSFEAAGEFVGMGDYRPMFGRYEVSFN